MDRTIKYIPYVWVILLTLCFSSCADQVLVDNKPQGEGTLLNIYASVNTGANTRLAELPLDQISQDNRGKKDVGLYIYYEDDYYGNKDLSKPYIRNLRCTVTDGKLTAPEEIYIYDRMVIVAFYPYNEAMNNEENYFTKLSNERAYPISESDYIDQLYIPYRAETTVNPTNAYMIKLGFGPQHTSKVEVVLTADATSSFPESIDLKAGKIKLLPTIDKLATNYTVGEDRRENWVDAITDFPENNATPVGGKYVRRYTAYVWKSAALSDDTPHHDGYTHENNILKKGEVLFESDELTLIVPATVNLSEQTVYRYGYNMDNGEIFIPTSDKLVYDVTSLQNVKFDEYRAYQVCDIDLNKFTTEWKPLATNNGTYDGGGHAINNLKINATPTADIAGSDYKKQMFGLFSDIMGTSTLMNINLVKPTITIDYSATALTDTCYVGAICGLINPELSEKAMREKIYNSLPKELSETVKQALVEEQMKNLKKTTSKIRGCKVTNPIITVTGNNVHVGALAGGAGNLGQKAEIKDSYITGGTIAVNADDATKASYANASVGGFCGTLSNGSITNCYSNMENISGYVKGTNAQPKEVSVGFCHLIEADKLPQGASVTVTDCYSQKQDAKALNFKDGHWPTQWPLFKDDEKATNHSLSGEFSGNPWPCYKWEDSWKDMGTQSSVYPALIWETPFTVENK